MSKMSQLHAELSEQAYELGYLTLDQALADGYEVDYRTSRLERSVDGREQAHKEWLKERNEVLADLELLKAVESTVEQITKDKLNYDPIGKINRAIEFIKKGEV